MTTTATSHAIRRADRIPAMEISEIVQLSEAATAMRANISGKSFDLARHARDMHGGNGFQEGIDICGHMANLETVNTCKATLDRYAAIAGRAQSALQAIS
jgi:hypothetical protein